jgi:uncharacterized protein (DUF302 family)
VDDAKVGLEKKVALPYEKAVEKAREALAKNGFGVLTEIDVRETLKKKIDVDFKKYVILGACNPPLAHRALSAEGDVGLLLPCNVIVYEEGDGAVVSAINPDMMVQMFDSEEMRSVAAEVGTLLRRVVESI